MVREMINCKTCRSWMLDFEDGRLSPARAAAMSNHLEECRACRAMAADSASARTALRGLPVAQTSPQFEPLLWARISERQERQTLTRWKWLRVSPIAALVRPALAVGAAACILAGTLWVHTSEAPGPSPAPAADSALISQCVALHARDVAAQPLTDAVGAGVTGARPVWTGATADPDAAQQGL